MSNKLKIWTDGSYRASVDTGGIGVVVVRNGEIINKISQKYANTTNNQMEILAIIQALKCITEETESVDIYTDSQYCLGIITKGWNAIKNVELWKQFRVIETKAKAFCNNINYIYTKGHHNDEFNNIADKLATDASGYTTPINNKTNKQNSK